MKVKVLPAALVLAMGATSFFLTGCGDKSASDKPATNSQEGKAPAEGGELHETQTITISNGTEPATLDPHLASGVPESNIIRQMLVGLTMSDSKGNTVPGMATEWSSDDNKVWTFKLRDAKWSNGDPVTAHDFVYSFRRLTSPENAGDYASYLEGLKVVGASEILAGKAAVDTLGVKAIDDKTLEVTLTEPVPYFPDAMIHSSVKPVHQKTIETHGDKWTSPANYVVNGAYKLKDWKINERIVLERNPAYFDDANTTITEAVFLPITQESVDVARYEAGEVDVTQDALPSSDFARIKAEHGAQLRVQPKLCTYYYEFNHTRAPFNDVRVRKALSLMIDRDTIADKVLAQGQTVAYQFTPTHTQGMKNYTPDWKAWDKNKRFEEANKLLTEAGFSASNPLKFELLYNTSESHKTIAVAAASFFKEASKGAVDVTLSNQEWKTYLDTRSKQNFDVARAGWCADYNEASTFLNVLSSTSGNNNGKYSNAEYDALLNKSLTGGISAEERNEIYRQAEALLDKDAAAIFVYQYVSPRLVKPYVQGFSENDPLNYFYVKDLRILKH